MKLCGKCLLLIALAVLPAAAQAQTASSFGRFHALVIGCQNYRHLSTLKTPLADAKEVAEVLETQYGFTVDLLLDKSRDEIMLALSELRKTMTAEEDSLLIYYAGHGYLDEASGAGYWQPSDAAADNTVYWIPTSEISNLLRAISVRHVLVVADSCYSGEIVMRNSEARLPAAVSRDEWLRRMQARRSRNALTSGLKEPVMDGGGGGHSVFAKALLDALRENRRILDGDTLFNLIKKPVTDNAPQQPVYDSIPMTGHDQGDFLFVPKDLQGDELQGQPERGTDLSFLQRGGGDSAATPPVVKTVAEQPSKNKPKQGDIMTDPATGMEFVYVPGGCFQMGSPETEKDRNVDEGPVHEVCVDGFYMGKHEVTQGQWKKVMNSNPSEFKKGDDYPVEQVSWEDTEKFIKKLNGKAGRKYRLPTEAEWEYAARAGTSTARHWGDDISCDKAMYENSLTFDSCVEYVKKKGLTPSSTAPVGSYPANQFGLHDMLGNVWEWCSDWYYSDYYASSPNDNPKVPVSSDRVFRGGSWIIRPRDVRAANRDGNLPGNHNYDFGFRLILPGQQSQAGR